MDVRNLQGALHVRARRHEAAVAALTSRAAALPAALTPLAPFAVARVASPTHHTATALAALALAAAALAAALASATLTAARSRKTFDARGVRTYNPRSREGK